jgi:multidrug efflux pump subunit AcrB
VITALAGWPARHPIAAFLILVLLSALGLAFAPWLPSQRLVPISGAWTRVEVALPGADSAQVDSLIARPLEESLAALSAPQRLISRSSEGVVEIRLEFSTALAREAALEDVNAQANSVLLPSGTQAPLVERDEPIVAPAAVYAVTGELSAETMQWAENSLRRPLQELAETSVVRLAGAEQVEILVQPDLRRMATLGLSFDDLIKALRGREEAPPRGARRPTVAGPASVEAVAARAVHLPGGDAVSLAEVAQVSLSRTPATSQPRHQGKPALLLHVYPRSPVDASLAAERANAHLAWLRANGLMPASVQVQSLLDESVETRKWRRQLLRRVGFSVLVALTVVSLFFGLRRGLVALALFAVWLPLAAAVFWAIGFTLNVMTALGLMLACIPLVLALTYSLSWRMFAAIAVALAGSLAVASLWSPFLRQVSAACFIAVMLGGIICWLLTPWLVSRSESFVRFLPQRWHGIAGAFSALLVALAIVISTAARTSVPPPAPAGVTDAALAVRLWGPDPLQVAEAARRLASHLRSMPGLIQVNDSTMPREHWRLQLDMPSLERHGITLAEIGRAFAIARDGLLIGDGLDGDKRMPLRLRLAPDVAGPAFERLLLRGEQRQQPAIYLRDLGVTLRVNAPAEQLRIQRMPGAEVRARVLSSEIPEQPAGLRAAIGLPDGYWLEWSADTVERMR